MSQIPSVIQEAEKNFAKFIRTKHAILVNSGTSALHTAYLACGIGKGDEVICPSFTYAATANMILHCGATPVFVDITEPDYLMNLSQMVDLITNKTKAVVFVNLFGKEKDWNELQNVLNLFKSRKIKLIIDSAQCIKPGVTYGDLQIFSFYRSKNFSCFEGGAITGNNTRLINKCRIIMNQGEDGKYNTVRLGFNYRMPDSSAVIINHQFMYHYIGGKAELGRFSPKDGHYPRTVYQQPLYKKLGYYKTYSGKCPVSERVAKQVADSLKK